MPGKYKFVLRRLIALAPTTLLAVTIIFFLMNVIPGDVALILLGQEAAPETLEIFRKELGLDAPVHERYFSWLGRVSTGDLGRSLRTSQAVSSLLIEKLPVTLSLALFSMLLALATGMTTGIISAVNRGTKVDTLISVGSYAGVSIPGFWLALVLILIFSVWLRIFPAVGFVNPIVDPVQGVRSLFLPAITLGAIISAFISRMTRSSLLDILVQEYIVTARAKGLSERIVIYRHALKNAMIPIVTVLGFQVGALLSGSVVIEEVFAMGGVGRLTYAAVTNRDYTVVQGVALLLVLVYIMTNFVVDMFYTYLDPRVRLE